MKQVQRQDIVDYATYNDSRDTTRAEIMKQKEARRIHVGQYLTFLFETTATVRYQIQEMTRLEQLIREKDILHEIETYNALLGGSGELGCTLMIEIDSEQVRDEKLTAWLGLMDHLYIKCADGSSAGATWDPAQVGDTRLSSVQYLKFDLKGQMPTAIGSNHPQLIIESALTEAQRQTLAQDLV